jgi:hypothetical protein
MRLLEKLERWLRPVAVPNLTLVLIVGQVLLFVLIGARPEVLERAVFIPSKVLQGEVWRLLTFLFLPPTDQLLWALIFWYVFYLFGSALEATWGDARYNLYLLIGFTVTVSAALGAAAITGLDQPASNGFLEGTVFLAFAYLYPDFQILLFFILPVRVKWLAMLAWFGYFWALISATDVTTRVVVVASVANYLAFFSRDILHGNYSVWRRLRWQKRVQRSERSRGPRHRCAICGITSETHPDMDFRYCTRCAGNHAYCSEHLPTHQHVQE